MPKYEKNETFLVGQSSTNAISLNEGALTGFTVTGSVITGTTVTFLASNNGADFYPLYDSASTEVSITVSSASPRFYSLEPSSFMAWNFIKARLGTSASAVNQATYNAEVSFIIDSML